MWLYGSGFPKSMSLDKAIEGKLTTGNANKTQFHKLNGEQEDKHHYGFTTSNKEQGFRPKDYTTEGESTTYLKKLEATTDLAKKYSGYGTALKPSFEPIIVARKPFKGSLVDNVIEYGVGGINIDECRVGTGTGKKKKVKYPDIRGDNYNQGHHEYTNTVEYEIEDNGRFPANTILTYDDTNFDEVCGGFPKDNKGNSNARYFYCAKASKKDRDEGLDEFENKYMAFSNQAKAELKRGNINFKGNEENPLNFVNSVSTRKNIHPTVKPTTLMQYLVRLVTPKGGIVLDPFMGSGSTGKAVMFENRERQANYSFIGIEKEKEYCDIARARIEWAKNYKDKTQENNQIHIDDLVEVEE